MVQRKYGLRWNISFLLGHIYSIENFKLCTYSAILFLSMAINPVYSGKAGQRVLWDPPPEPSGGSGVISSSVGTTQWGELFDFEGTDEDYYLLPSTPFLETDPLPGPLTPAVQIGFNGVINSPATSIPPDTHIAVGPNLSSAGRVMMVTNGHVQLWDKTGTVIAGPTLLGTFFSASCFDPKVLYDEHSERFFVVALEGKTPNPGGTSNIHMAASSTSTPNNLTTDWTFSVGTGLTNIGGFDTWSDYPGIGADSDSLFVTANLFDSGDTFRGTKIRVFNKASLIAGIYSFVDIHYDASVAFTIQPAHTYGPTDNGGFYLISRIGSTAYRIFNITGDPGAPVATTSSHSWSGGTFPSDTGADQCTVAEPDLDTLASRIMNAVYRNGQIWLCLTSDPDNDGRTEVVWQAINTNNGGTPSVAQSGFIDGTVSDAWTYMPSINVNTAGGAAICYTQSSAAECPGMYYTMRTLADSLNTFQSPQVALAGPGFYDSFADRNPDRWGDYSATVVDPDNDCFWIANEFSFYSGVATSEWGTYIASFCPEGTLPPNGECASAICIEDGVAVNGSNVGATGSTLAGCDFNDPNDVWYSYTPAENDPNVTISLCGSTFDTTLAVLEDCNDLVLIACNDDFCGAQSELVVPMIGGVTYLIRVSGAGDSSGDFTLQVTGGMGTCTSTCQPAPQVTSGPQPANNAQSVSVSGTELSWTPVGEPGVTNCLDTDGSANFGISTTRFRTNVVSMDNDRILTEIKADLEFTGNVDITYIVYEADSPSSVYTKILEQTMTINGTGRALYSSGNLSIALQSGMTYGIGYGWEGSARYFGDISLSFPHPFFDGTVEGGFGFNSAPPYPSGFTLSGLSATLYSGSICFETACPVSYDVYFDSSNPPTTLTCPDSAFAVCDPTSDPNDPNAVLSSCTTYYWRVVTKNCCSPVASPIWSFTTGDLPADLDGSGRVDLIDLALLAGPFGTGGPCYDPDWCGGADINRNGSVGLDDLLLMGLYWLNECTVP